MHEVLVNRLGGLSLPRKSVVRLTDHPDMTLDVYRGLKTTIQQQFLELIMSDALEEHDGMVSIGGRNITYLRSADDIDALAEEEQELEASTKPAQGIRWTLPAHLGPLKTGQDGKGLLRTHMWCPSKVME